MSTTWCLTFFLVICLYHRAQGVSITKNGCDDESIPSASHIKFTSSSTGRCQRNFSWRRKWNLRAVAVTIRYPHNHTTQACRSDLNHLLDMTPIFSMHHVSRSEHLLLHTTQTSNKVMHKPKRIAACNCSAGLIWAVHFWLGMCAGHLWHLVFMCIPSFWADVFHHFLEPGPPRDVSVRGAVSSISSLSRTHC